MTSLEPEQFLEILDEFTVGDLRAQAGHDLLDRPLHELGFESAELIEVVARIETWHGVRLPNPALCDAHTLRELLGVINASLARAAACRRPVAGLVWGVPEA